MIELIISHGILTTVLLMAGIILYYSLNYLIEIPGRNKLNRVFGLMEEKEKRWRKKRIATRIYLIVLVWMVLAINIAFYYILKGRV